MGLLRQDRAKQPGHAPLASSTSPVDLAGHVTALQASVGNQATRWLLDRLSTPVQRDVGFEYEVNRETYAANAPLTVPQRQQASLGQPAWATGVSLGKGALLVGNMNGFMAKTDLGGAWGDTNLELEITHVPETNAGRQRLLANLKKLEQFCRLLDRERANNFHHISAGKLAAALGGNHPVPNAYIHAWGGQTTGNPQATVGVRLDRVALLMEQAVGGPTAGPFQVVPGPGVPLARLELGRTPTNINDFALVGDAPRLVRTGITNYLAAHHGGAAPVLGFPSAALVGMCAIMLTYFTRGSGPMLAYAKQIAPLMARTDFGSMFTNDIPAPERVWLSGGVGAGAGVRFRNMWTYILNAAAIGGGLAAPLYAVDPGAAPGADLPGALTRRQWIDSIRGGVDPLTSANAPAVAAGVALTAGQAWLLNESGFGVNAGVPSTGPQAAFLNANGFPGAVAGQVLTPAQAALLNANGFGRVAGTAATAPEAVVLTQQRSNVLFGLGGLGPAHDVVNPGVGAVNAPIFELRRMYQGVTPHAFTEMALGIFDYIRALNATAAGLPGAYARVPRAVSALTLGQKFRFYRAA